MKRLCSLLFVTGMVLASSALGQDGIAYAWRNLAGQPGGPGDSDGACNVARFNQPWGVAVDTGGNIYVAEGLNHTIRKIRGGVVTTLAGFAGLSGNADDTNSAARFNYPTGVAVDSAGNVYVADELRPELVTQARQNPVIVPQNSANVTLDQGMIREPHRPRSSWTLRTNSS